MNTSIKLKFRSSKVNDREGAIFMQLIHNRKVKCIRTRFHLHPQEWDKKNETPVYRTGNPERDKFLQSIKVQLEAELRQMTGLVRLLEIRGAYTLEEVADLYVNNSYNGYLFPFIDFVVKDLIKGNRRKTAKICLTARKSFERFLDGQDILIDSMDCELMRRYEIHLKTARLMKNTISCYMRALRSVYNQAVRCGLAVQKNPFAGIFTRIDKTVKRAVNEDVITMFKNMDLSAYSELSLARDLFMFSFYMRGMSFVDMANLRKSNVKSGYIVYVRSKTKQMLSVKIEGCMQEIIDRYARRSIDDYLLFVYTVKNRDYSSQLRNHNKRLKRISEMLELQNPLSSYVSRHTWATLAMRKGVPIEVISESMGHRNEGTTRIYLASLGQSVVDKANADVIRLG